MLKLDIEALMSENMNFQKIFNDFTEMNDFKLYRCRYSVHGAIIEFITNSYLVSQDFFKDYHHFYLPFDSNVQSNAKLCVFVVDEKDKIPISIPNNSTIVSTNLTSRYYTFRNLFFEKFHNGGSIVCIDFNKRIFISFTLKYEEIYISIRKCFKAFVSEILEKNGIYSLHAAAMGINGKTILFPASCSGGKTTIAMALAKAKFGFLTDDFPFIRVQNQELDVLSFPERIKACLNTINFFPELKLVKKNSVKVKYHDGTKKWIFDIEELYPESVIFPGAKIKNNSNGLIIFPHLCTKDSVRIKKISQIEAIQKLIPNMVNHRMVYPNYPNNVLRARFETIICLACTNKCYDLYVGNDPKKLASVILNLS